MSFIRFIVKPIFLKIEDFLCIIKDNLTFNSSPCNYCFFLKEMLHFLKSRSKKKLFFITLKVDESRLFIRIYVILDRKALFKVIF